MKNKNESKNLADVTEPIISSRNIHDYYKKALAKLEVVNGATYRVADQSSMSESIKNWESNRYTD